MDTENFPNSNDMNPKEHPQTNQSPLPVSAGLEGHNGENDTSKDVHEPLTDSKMDISKDVPDNESEITDTS